MTKTFLILSDIHYDEESAVRAIEKEKNAATADTTADTTTDTIDTVLFLGDGYRVFDNISLHYPRIAFLGVKGNCDYDAPEAPLRRIITVNGIGIYVCHGHHLSVKSGTFALGTTAVSEGCSVALFGHTHIPLIEEKTFSAGKITLFNPGSIGNPPPGRLRSYGLLTVADDGSFEVSVKQL